MTYEMLVKKRYKRRNFSNLATSINTDIILLKEMLEEKEIKQNWLADKFVKSLNMFNGYVQNKQQSRLGIYVEIANVFEIDIKGL